MENINPASGTACVNVNGVASKAKTSKWEYGKTHVKDYGMIYISGGSIGSPVLVAGSDFSVEYIERKSQN